jgi:SNF2 family DNA or RNA helicase
MERFREAERTQRARTASRLAKRCVWWREPMSAATTCRGRRCGLGASGSGSMAGGNAESPAEPAGLGGADPGDALKGTLRPYQQVGVRWLYLLTKLGLGACLADDMGLGKTIQVLALLLLLKRESGANPRPSLLVAPASLLANWASEIERFAPGLKTLIAHPSAGRRPISRLWARSFADVDLVITSYGSLLRAAVDRRGSVAAGGPRRSAGNQEPGCQTDARRKESQAGSEAGADRHAGGKPPGGSVVDLFDFINPGLLGSAKEFTKFTKRLADRPARFLGPLRELVRPYILRRLKTDKSVIADLPDKTEIKAFCPLSRSQAALYEQAVKELAGQLADSTGIKRKGLVLSYLMRFKQICNHPSQWLGDGAWSEDDSGKWARLREIAEVVAARQEKMLVFTQFREMTAPLAAFLGSVFERPGLVLHGETSVKKRKDLVRRFQEDESVGSSCFAQGRRARV